MWTENNTTANSYGFVGLVKPTMKPVLNGTDYTSVNLCTYRKNFREKINR